MKKYYVLAVLSLTIPLSLSQAEELDSFFKKVNELAAEENYPKAIEELSWAQKELEKRHLAKVEKLIPSEIAGFTGGAFQSQSTMGMTSIERTYTKGSEKLKLSIAGGSGGGPMAGFAALGRMAGMLGTQPGMETFRLEGRTANLQVQGNRAELTVFLDSGSLLKIEQSATTDGSSLKQAAESIKADIVKLDEYLKGSAG